MQADWVRQWALFSPKAVAFADADSDRAWTYEALDHSCRALAGHLRDEFGVVHGDRVAVLATNEMEWIPLFFALARLGAILVPINFRLTAFEISHLLADSGARLLIHQTQFRKAERSWPFDGPEGLVAFLDEFSARPLPDAGTPVPEAAARAEADACMILYTSGTTGAPKGALITNGMLFWNSLNTTLRLDLRQGDVALSFMPFFHTGGWNVLLTPFVHRGAQTVVLRKFDAARVLELCASERVTVLFAVPTMMSLMAQEPGFAGVDLTSVRFAVVGGEPMPIELIKTWQAKGVAVRQGYGLTEFGPNVFSLNEGDSLRKIGSIGFPNFYVEARVLDDRGEEITDGSVGELALKGPVCTPGYWNDEAATRAAMRDGWLMTGDLVRRDEDGFYYVAGRKKDMFISGGENVYPVEVERVLSAHPAIREVAVIGVPDGKWGEVGQAFIALNQACELTAAQVIEYCLPRLAKFKIPKHVEFLPQLPKGDSGKILKRELRPADQMTV